MALKIKILIIRGAKIGHPSFALVREKASNAENRTCVLEKKLPVIPL